MFWGFVLSVLANTFAEYVGFVCSMLRLCLVFVCVSPSQVIPTLIFRVDAEPPRLVRSHQDWEDKGNHICNQYAIKYNVGKTTSQRTPGNFQNHHCPYLSKIIKTNSFHIETKHVTRFEVGLTKFRSVSSNLALLGE